MRYETPIIDFLLLEDDLVLTSTQPGLEINPGGDVGDQSDWDNWNL